MTPGWELGWLIRLSVGGEIFLKLCVNPVYFSWRAEVRCSPGKGWWWAWVHIGRGLPSVLWALKSPFPPSLVWSIIYFLLKKTPPTRLFFPPLLLMVDLEIPEAPTCLFWDPSLSRLLKWGFKKAETLLSQEEKLSTLIWEGWWLKVLSSRGGDKTYTMSHIIQQEWEYQIDSCASELGISLTTWAFYLPGYFLLEA